MVLLSVKLENIHYQQQISSVIMAERQEATENPFEGRGMRAFVAVKEKELGEVVERTGFTTEDQDDEKSVL